MSINGDNRVRCPKQCLAHNKPCICFNPCFYLNFFPNLSISLSLDQKQNIQSRGHNEECLKWRLSHFPEYKLVFTAINRTRLASPGLCGPCVIRGVMTAWEGFQRNPTGLGLTMVPL